MNARHYIILMIGLFLLLCPFFIASAEKINDTTGDVFHWSQTGTAWSWKANISDKPNIDITEINYAMDQSKLKMRLNVAGTIQHSEYYWYNMFFNTSDTVYMWSWSNGSNVSMAYNQAQQKYDMKQNFTINNNSINVEFNVIGNTSIVEIWGQAHQYTTIESNQQHNEWWGDWAPDSKFTGVGIHDDNDTDGTDDDINGGNGNTSKPSTPGFEFLAVIIASAVTIVLFRKNH